MTRSSITARAWSRSPRTRGHAGGVTLLELLLAMVVAAIVLAIATPSFRSVARRAAVLAATHEVMTALHATRTAAITRGLPGTVCLTTSTLACVVGRSGRGTGLRGWLEPTPRRAPRYDPGDPLIVAAALPAEIEIRGSRTSVTFWPAARAGTTNTLTVCDRLGVSPPEQVIISQSGRPRLARGNAVACR